MTVQQHRLPPELQQVAFTLCLCQIIPCSVPHLRTHEVYTNQSTKKISKKHALHRVLITTTAGAICFKLTHTSLCNSCCCVRCSYWSYCCCYFPLKHACNDVVDHRHFQRQHPHNSLIRRRRYIIYRPVFTCLRVYSTHAELFFRKKKTFARRKSTLGLSTVGSACP